MNLYDTYPHPPTLFITKGLFMRKTLELRYFEEAPDSIDGWERYSLPIGNGRFGASIFSGTEKERIQITTNEFANPYSKGGVSNFLEIHLEFPKANISNYERGLRLNDGTIYSSYEADENSIRREAFYSHPDKVLVYRLSAKHPISLLAKLIIPFLGERTVEEGGRTGQLQTDGEDILARGTLPSRDLIYEGRMRILTDGKKETKENGIEIHDAKHVTLLFVGGTSYKLCKETFFTEKAMGEDPHEDVLKTIEQASKKSYASLYQNHKNDYTSLMNRVDFSLSTQEDKRSVPELLEAYRKNEWVPYLIELYFFFGRHLLISSSRKGGLPSSLQGVWTAHDKSPWGSGFWHNINIQMNYWPAFITNLSETFEPYIDFFKAYLPKAQANAKKYIEDAFHQDVPLEETGWIIGTGAFAYEIEGLNPEGHSGPGTGGMTGQLFVDAYDYSLDEDLLKDCVYPCVHGLAKFFQKCIKQYGDEYLCTCSASPEQILSGHWCNGDKKQQYYHTIGCAFDQQWFEENAKNDLRFAKILNEKDEVIEREKQQIHHYGSIQIGYSGQIKEYGEEHFYGEIGEYQHRHLSELVGLMPADLITHQTPAYLDAAKLTLSYRGNFSTGWALAHRLCCQCRIGDGDHAYALLKILLQKKTHPNLWDVHPPFQIDGNFGATAGIAEMLLQSHEGYLSILPALPSAWENVYMKGLKARGNFDVDILYSNKALQEIQILSNKGENLLLYYPGVSEKTRVLDNGENISFEIKDHFISLKTKIGHTYTIIHFQKVLEKRIPQDFKAVYQENGVLLSWKGSEKVALYRAKENEPTYELIGTFEKESSFLDQEYSLTHKGRVTYKLVDAESSYSQMDKGALAYIHPATQLEEDRYQLKIHTNNLIAEKIGWDF